MLGFYGYRSGLQDRAFAPESGKYGLRVKLSAQRRLEAKVVRNLKAVKAVLASRDGEVSLFNR